MLSAFHHFDFSRQSGLFQSKNGVNLPCDSPRPTSIAIWCSKSKETAPVVGPFVKQLSLQTLLLTSALLWSHPCRSEPVGGVTLAMAATNASAILSWPYPSRGYELQVATNLSMTNWVPAPVTAVSNGGRWQVTLPTSQSSSFFRLKNHLQYFGFWAGSVAAGGSITEQQGTVNFTMGAGPGASGNQAVAAGMNLMFFAPDFS